MRVQLEQKRKDKEQQNKRTLTNKNTGPRRDNTWSYSRKPHKIRGVSTVDKRTSPINERHTFGNGKRASCVVVVVVFVVAAQA